MRFINSILKGIRKLRCQQKHGLGISQLDNEDRRDFIYNPEIVENKKAGTSSYFTLKNFGCKILNQQQTNSCTGHAGIAAMNIILSRFIKPEDHKLNPWFVYYYARKEDYSSTDIDSGATMRSLLKSLYKYGVYRCDMDSPYSKPKNINYDKCFHISNYYRCNNDISKIKYALESEKLPVLLCFKVYDNDIDDYYGYVGKNNKKTGLRGYHAICLTGYKYIDNELYFEFQNSWGRSWGDDGYGYLHENYLKSSDLCPDIWIPTFIKS